jgi:hypothetical protein
MRPLPHGYTNDTSGDGTVVIKRYAGPDAEVRRELERGVLIRLKGLLPVPPVLDAPGAAGALSRRELALGFVHGAHGQDLMDAGRAAEVLLGSGRVLARIHDLDVTEILPGSPAASGEVLIHGDFGPQNLLFGLEAVEAVEAVETAETSGSLAVVAVLDWEWAHVGQRIEDLAWCEWIVRMHHPDQVGALGAFFAGYGAHPAWAERHAAMLTRCRRLIDFCEGWVPDGDGVAHWRRRLAVTAGWAE